MRPTFSSAPTIAAAMPGCFPKGPSPMSGSASQSNRDELLKPLLAALCEKLASERRIGTRTLGAHRRRHTGGRALAFDRPLGRNRRICWPAMRRGSPIRSPAPASPRRCNREHSRGARRPIFSATARARSRAYEEELGDIFDAALNRALRRRREVLACYAGGGRPDARALSDGWIASPHYWAA